ncbi:hypothetical protein WH47_05237 [Habropoda laboriosa]|uniref:Copia protein n=1 Tax=Habropoda laboriosa TaxID=597456 RepID=A0A0L7RKH4_9HYME|nr:hypothetical protein WH47_05237 [Habropoda laboriosa]
MMTQANLPSSVCAEAVNTAAYMRNRCPTRKLDKTSHEELTGKKSYIGFFRIIGSKTIASDKRHNPNKFAPKGEEYVLVGYSQVSRVYRL